MRLVQDLYKLLRAPIKMEAKFRQQLTWLHSAVRFTEQASSRTVVFPGYGRHNSPSSCVWFCFPQEIVHALTLACVCNSAEATARLLHVVGTEIDVNSVAFPTPHFLQSFYPHATMSPFQCAVACENVNLMRILREHGANVNLGVVCYRLGWRIHRLC
jgi:hypothetical protein